jgi:hypothetical protein
MAELKIGDVVALPLGAIVLQNRSSVIQIDREAEYVIESVRHFEAGSEDDHFTPGSVIDLRELASGGLYDAEMPLLTVAFAGDFREEYIQRNLSVLYSLRKTFVR